MMYVNFGVVDQDGELEDGFAIKVRMVNWHGLNGDRMLWDIVHEDGTHERIAVHCNSKLRFQRFKLGESSVRIVNIRILEFAHPVLTKDEFHARIGKGKFIHPQRGHFVDASELPEASK